MNTKTLGEMHARDSGSVFVQLPCGSKSQSVVIAEWLRAHGIEHHVPVRVEAVGRLRVSPKDATVCLLGEDADIGGRTVALVAEGADDGKV